MDGPFFKNRHWYQQPDPALHPFNHTPSYRGVPVYQVDPNLETHLPSRPGIRPPERNPGSKVVQVPVHFVGSEEIDRSGSALKIQKVFRAFLVRKCLKKIKDVKVQVDEIEERLSKSEVLELVRRDERERLRVNESLMSLLFKLDSICGVDSGVRGCRKAVIRKAIALQERIDAIVAIDLDGNGSDGEALNSPNESHDPVKPTDSLENVGNLEGSIEYQENSENASCVGEGDNKIMECEGNDSEVEIIDVEVDREVKVSEANCVGSGVQENLDHLVQESVDGNRADDDKRNSELLERMVESNEKMMSLMTKLFERSEAQTRALNALAHRVELLEKAFVCDMMPRRKKTTKMKKKAECRED